MTIQEEIVEISTPTGPMRTAVLRPAGPSRFPSLLLYSEIFQITGPVRRIAAFLAGHGHLVAVPEIYHEFVPAGTVLGYDTAGADAGNAYKIAKELSAYDGDARAALDFLRSHAQSTGRLGVAGVCIGGHLAFRAARNEDVLAAACFYATDLHKRSLGKGMQDDTLETAPRIRGELLMVWGRQDPHVPFAGRTVIRERLEAADLNFQWHEVNGAHAFLRDEGPRYDAGLASQCYAMALELFHRRLAAV